MNYLKKRSCVGAVLLFITFLFSTAAIRAQDNENRIRVETNLVLVNVLVYDKNGQLVSGLTSKQFEIFDDDVRRPIESFSSEDAGVSFGIVYDLHPTTPELTRSVVESLAQFKRGLRAHDDLFLVAFNMRGQQTFDFVPALDQLEKFMSAPQSREPYSLYDAVYFASDRIQSSRNQKKVLLIISDSADHHSRHTLSEVRKRIAGLRTEVYAVIFNSDSGFDYADLGQSGKGVRPIFRDASALDRAAIQDLTLKNGGSAYFAGSQSTLRLYNIFTEIGAEMRSHYTLGFYPDVIDARSHSIRIRLKRVPGSKDFTLTYRMSYQNPATGPSSR